MTHLVMVVKPIGQSVKLIVCEFAILDDGFADEQKLGVGS
jgi:hypothetical protein